MNYKSENSYNIARNGFSMRRFSIIQIIIILCVAIGHISTMPLGPGNPEIAQHFGYDPSWFGMNVLFMLSGYMALRSLARHGSVTTLLKSRFAGIFPMLTTYTALIIFVIYPLFGQAAQSFSQLAAQMSLYAIDVISCINPGRPLKGLLDEAHYSCIIQGATWTFRWGAIAFMGLGAAHVLKLLGHKTAIFAMAVISLSSYVLAQVIVVNFGISVPEILFAPLRLGAMFTIGMATYAYRDQIKCSYAIAAILLALAIVHHVVMPWSPLIEIIASLFWGYCALIGLAESAAAPQKAVTRRGFAAALFIFHWPIAQLLLVALPEITSIGLILITLPVTIVFSTLINRAYLYCASIVKKAIAERKNPEVITP